MDNGLKLVVGLGNPGPNYAHNRHNVGFRLADRLATDNGLSFTRRQCHAQVASGNIAGRRVLLARPLTYMNLSGTSVAGLVRFYKVRPADVIVAYDDLDLPLGRIRLRAEGGSGGHNGVKSIIERLGTDQFARLRIGIGRPSAGEPADYVLDDFRGDEKPAIEAALDAAAQAVVVWLDDGIEAAMNRFNNFVSPAEVK